MGWLRARSPSRPSLVSDMIKAQIMENHGIPVGVLELSGNVPGDIVVHFGKVL